MAHSNGFGSWIVVFVLHLLLLLPSSSLLHSPPNTSILFPNPTGMESSRSRGGSGGGRSSSGGGGKGGNSEKPPPLELLRSLGEAGRDWAGLLKDFGANVGVERNATTGEQYLVGRNTGVALLDSTGRKVVVGGDGGVSKTRFTQLGLPGTAGGGGTGIRKEPVAGRAGNRPGMNATTPIPMPPASGFGILMGGGATSGSSQWSVAACRPEEQTVALHGNVAHYEPHIIHHPRCVRVERCGGCCGTDILACEATETSEVEVPIQKFVWVSELGKMNWVGQEWVKVERHTKCECRCRTKAQDCTGLQIYQESACLCTCGNRAEQERCEESLDDKVWDPVKCVCTCREIRDCSSGFYFNLGSCQCLPLGSKKRGRRHQSSYQLQHHPHDNATPLRT